MKKNTHYSIEETHVRLEKITPESVQYDVSVRINSENKDSYKVILKVTTTGDPANPDIGIDPRFEIISGDTVATGDFRRNKEHLDYIRSLSGFRQKMRESVLGVIEPYWEIYSK